MVAMYCMSFMEFLEFGMSNVFLTSILSQVHSILF